MPQKRREFFKTVAGGSVAVLAGPVLSFEEIQARGKDIARTAQQVFTTKKLSADVVIAGGGMSGVNAAISAARNGASVILIQNRSRLGGNASSEIRMHVLGANSPEKTRNWRETGIIEELKLTEAATNPQRSFEVWDLILYDKVVSEKNIRLLLDTSVIDVTVDRDRIRSIKAVSSWVEEYYEIEGHYFVDCTGDATLAALAGALYMRGREGQDVFGESLAPPVSDNKTMGNSILFFARQHDRPMPFHKPSWARTFTKEDFLNRPINSWEYGYWWLEWGGELDTIKDNRRIRHELLRIVLGVWDYIKNSGNHPDAANWALDWVGMIPGKRESRRIIGDHIMIQQELERAEPYPDRVAYGGWPMDDHPPGGIDRKDLKPCQQIYLDRPYHIPLRSLYSKNRPNLFMAGRNISASHVAFSSTRVMATCSVIGQAVGAAASFCIEKNISPRELVAERSRLQEFQQMLLKEDQALIGIKNEDPKDLARRARVSASTETNDGRAVSVIDGWNRNIEDGKTHQWQARMQNGSQWIQLQWDRKKKISEILITFDSGLNRKLFLTGLDSEYFKQIRGPQPETVADYTIETRINGTWQRLVDVKDNFLRFRKHTLAPVRTDAIRIVVSRTNGDELARIFQVRCYT